MIGAHTSEQGRSLKDSARSAGSPDATTQNIPSGMAATVTGTNWDWRQIGGSACVLSGRACHSALRCRAGINQGRGYRPGRGWTSLGEPIGGWPGSRCRAQPAAGPSCAGNPCSSHGRPPSGPPVNGTARHGRHRFDLPLVRLAAGDRLMGVQLGFMGVQLGGKVIGAGAVAAAGGCRRAVLRWAPRDGAAAVRPWHGAPSRPLPSPFQQVTGSAAQPGDTAASPGRRGASPAGPRLC